MFFLLKYHKLFLNLILLETKLSKVIVFIVKMKNYNYAYSITYNGVSSTMFICISLQTRSLSLFPGFGAKCGEIT